MLAHFGEVRAEAVMKVARWSKQTRRMEQDMTKLVHIKTKALEDKKYLKVTVIAFHHACGLDVLLSNVLTWLPVHRQS